ncbi:unnamed protein product [Ectocarpus sp. 13 AM-2016]
MADHRDFLGAIVNLGVTRDGIGDILVQGERGAQVLVDPVMAEFLAGSLTSVRSVKVKVRPIPLEELAVRPAKMKDVRPARPPPPRLRSERRHGHEPQ